MRLAIIAVIVPLLLLACSEPEPAEPGWVFPPVDWLPEQVEPPDPFVTFFGGEAVETPQDWEQLREPELEALFGHYLYGFAGEEPDVAVALSHAAPVLVGASLRELEITYGTAPALHVALFLPDGIADPPVIVGLNKCGNHTVTADEAVTVGTGWSPDDCDPARGSRADQWDLEATLAAGFAVATVYHAEIDPDDRKDAAFTDGVHPHLEAGDPPWATLAAWAWGLSRVVDGLIADGAVDPDRIVVFGHSRRGKAALLAGALDERIAMVWAHQSGTGGAALSRSLEGEPIGVITMLFPHWFVPEFATFAGQETRLPVDQHLLLAMIAPRPLLVIDGADDAWADPAGAERAVELARPVWELYGAEGLAWTLRDGGHEVRAEDWARAVAHAGEWL